MRISHSIRIVVVVLLSGLFVTVAGQRRSGVNSALRVPAPVLLQIIRVEDERRWDDTLKKFLADQNAQVRKRAALAAGRIGNEGAVPVLAEMLLQDRDTDVRQMAAFALGEIESPGGAYALVEVLKRLGNENASVRARAVEALGKIAGAMIANAPPAGDTNASKTAEDDRLGPVREAILDTLRFEAGRRSAPDRLTILLGLTAVLRAKPDGVGKLVAQFLGYSDPRIVADALNTLARLRLKDGQDEARQLLVKHSDPIVRANAARLLGVAEDKGSFDALLDRALHDSDLRVRVSAIRALGTLKDERAAQPLVRRATLVTISRNEELEIISTIGNIFEAKGGMNGEMMQSDYPLVPTARGFIRRRSNSPPAPELEIAAVKVNPGDYMDFPEGQPYRDTSARADDFFSDWRRAASKARGLATVNSLTVEKYGSDVPRYKSEAQETLQKLMGDTRLSALALPDVLTAYVAFRPSNAAEALKLQLRNADVIVRSTAAELLGNEPLTEANARALIDALPRALRDVDNDAALAILDALAKQKSKEANDAIKTALNSQDHLIRRRAVALLKANGVGEFSNRIGTVQTRNTDADYRRAIARIGERPTATVVTSKGSFTIEFLPEDAPLTVDNFIQLAKKRYFNGQTIPRVVPNFVVQAGDPRGDQNGGPGYQIRCEINEVPYERGAVGMALSGKDTGGSQWFVTHSPQPHLDGGYTVFGRVIRGMDVVDQIARGDRILRVVVNEK